MDSDQQLVLSHYRMMFPDLASLGSGNPPAKWQAEYTRIAESGLAATLITGSTFESGGATAQKNFPQTVLMRGLLTVRAELDPAFDDLAFAPPRIRRRQNLGVTLRLGDGPGSYETL